MLSRDAPTAVRAQGAGHPSGPKAAAFPRRDLVAQKQYFAKQTASFAVPSVDFVSQMLIICDIPPNK
jgi:hypothetical protein